MRTPRVQAALLMVALVAAPGLCAWLCAPAASASELPPCHAAAEPEPSAPESDPDGCADECTRCASDEPTLTSQPADLQPAGFLLIAHATPLDAWAPARASGIDMRGKSPPTRPPLLLTGSLRL